MEKIFLAIGNREMEEYLQNTLAHEVKFVGETVYREGVMRGIGQSAPTAVILREVLKGSIDITKLIYDIRTTYPDVRVIYIGTEKDNRDNFYATLVNYGVYDLIVGGRVNVADVIERIRIPGKHADVKHYQPAPLQPQPNPYPNSEPQVITQIAFEDEDVEDGEEEMFEVKKEETPDKKSGLLTKLKNVKPTLPKKEEKVEEKVGETEDVEPAEKKFSFLKKGERPDTQKITGVPAKEFAKEKIITFIGGRSGVGTTAIAVNTAFELAMRGSKVLYLEVNKLHPSATYWFDLGMDKLGIDAALKAVEKKDYNEVAKSIVKTANLKQTDSAMKSNYKKFPDGLDFMSYSKNYLMGLVTKEGLPELQELYLYLMYQGGYDFVIVDMSFSASERDIHGAILYSNRVFTVLNQDISTVGYHLAFLKMLENAGVSIGAKNHYIVNSFSRSKFGEKDLKEWLNVNDLIVIPNCTTELSESNSNGLPTIINSKRSDFSTSIKEITKIIGGK